MTSGVARGVRRGVHRGGDKGGADPCSRQPPTTQEGDLRGATCERGAGGAGGLNGLIGANQTNPPPSDPPPARQVTLQVMFGVGG